MKLLLNGVLQKSYKRRAKNFNNNWKKGRKIKDVELLEDYLRKTKDVFLQEDDYREHDISQLKLQSNIDI